MNDGGLFNKVFNAIDSDSSFVACDKDVEFTFKTLRNNLNMKEIRSVINRPLSFHQNVYLKIC